MQLYLKSYQYNNMQLSRCREKYLYKHYMYPLKFWQCVCIDYCNNTWKIRNNINYYFQKVCSLIKKPCVCARVTSQGLLFFSSHFISMWLLYWLLILFSTSLALILTAENFREKHIVNIRRKPVFINFLEGMKIL